MQQPCTFYVQYQKCDEHKTAVNRLCRFYIYFHRIQIFSKFPLSPTIVCSAFEWVTVQFRNAISFQFKYHRLYNCKLYGAVQSCTKLYGARKFLMQIFMICQLQAEKLLEHMFQQQKDKHGKCQEKINIAKDRLMHSNCPLLIFQQIYK